jgi:hypothetical protein
MCISLPSLKLNQSKQLSVSLHPPRPVKTQFLESDLRFVCFSTQGNAYVCQRIAEE